MCNIRQLVMLIIFIVIVLSIGFLSGYVTSTNITSWYQSLNHPIFSPPNWLFAPVWSVIYIMIAFSAWLIFIQEKFKGKILYVFVITLHDSNGVTH
ncbi:tryptophan-rich sensory protein [Thiotrichales bacterium 19X7-9]|nr:tryptophan-rich sensory protein [Thiotrichales bacterium 19X7-9]